MVTKLTIHCDCGTDVRTETTDGSVACPDCESAFETTIIEFVPDHDAPSTRYGTRSNRGP
ncbi:hypothetical protein [Natrialba swarupiae]|uniref:Small CPxCG-related zinc finger protein n=1 Tax=Natrialba swarupiae TaxID=2448032 RepID=A0A5D5AUL4_9EURY|nr:hypothetical protein [Natrialba swarupiae]MCW8172159.1 hypothetical protein [Natrialba swarupiae]TYT62761.1 hypothetical protein FYC77_06940 [Natrialba swarupiae]